ncbi:MAG: hypothetical protein WC005_11205 [Candidatus Nanopelagicales bacterium]
MTSHSRAATVRSLSGPALRALYRLQVEGAELVPASGGVIFEIEGDGLLAIPVLKAVAPRPVHAIIDGALGQVLLGSSRAWAGDIPLDGLGFGAANAAIDLLRAGDAVAILGETPPLGLLLAASGAQLQPVRITGASGRVPTDPPRPRARIGIVFEAPIHISPIGDPYALATVQQLSEQVRQARADARARR